MKRILLICSVSALTTALIVFAAGCGKKDGTAAGSTGTVSLKMGKV